MTNTVLYFDSDIRKDFSHITADVMSYAVGPYHKDQRHGVWSYFSKNAEGVFRKTRDEIVAFGVLSTAWDYYQDVAHECVQRMTDYDAKGHPVYEAVQDRQGNAEFVREHNGEKWIKTSMVPFFIE